MTEQQTQQMPPVKVAFIIDEEVVDVLHTDDRLAAILLSKPTMVDVTSIYSGSENVNLVGLKYDGKEFKR